MDFKAFFGVIEKDIKYNCIICQGYDLSLFSSKISNGLFAKCANIANATVIALKNNFLAGDAVLYLKNTVCENIFLFGSCGGCNKKSFGDMVIIDKAYNLESFSTMLNFKKEPDIYESTRLLFNDFFAKSGSNGIIKTNSACVSSLILEPNFLNWFNEKEISVVDMESSIIFSAANHINKNAIALMYVTDFIGQDIEASADIANKQKMATSRKNLAQALESFCDKIEHDNFKCD
jgi:purine-nucleoside phosphorylase